MGKITRLEFEENLIKDDVVKFYLSKTTDELTNEICNEVGAMVGFEQKNSHHCYDLYEHTLRTIEGIKKDELTTSDWFTKLRVAAFFHDIAKPMVSSFNPKTGQQVFYGHAIKSAMVARTILESLGYDKEEIDVITFLIGHHDDFISYKTKLAPYMKNHVFIRNITPYTVAEKIIENKYNFKKMGYEEDQIRYICYYLVNKIKPYFKNKAGEIKIDVNMEEVYQKINSGNYDSSFVPSLEDYLMLIKLCRADAGAQSDVAIQNGRIVGSKKEKLENFDNIEKVIKEAYEMVN